MKNRSLFLASALALAGLSIASAKSYDIILSNNAMAGNVQLQPGEYRMKIEGSNAVFQNVNTGKSVTAPFKAANGDKKHSQTSVETTKSNNGDKLQSIELGGSTETLQFGE
jgi:hypothetical protein